MPRCKACGIQLREGARFCDMCGTKVDRLCPRCGEVLRDQARYCDMCGVKLPLPGQVDRPVQRWAIAAGRLHSVALRADGTVLTAGDNQFGQCGAGGWTDMIAVAAGKYHTVCVRSDGTVRAVGDGALGQCDVDRWTDVVAVAAGDAHTVGLRRDGTVLAAGKDVKCDVGGWKDVIAVAAGLDHSLGLRRDGTVVASSRYADRVYLGVGLHAGYGSAQRMYVKRGYVPDGTGAWYDGAVCPPYADCRNDDDLVLYLSKSL